MRCNSIIFTAAFTLMISASLGWAETTDDDVSSDDSQMRAEKPHGTLIVIAKGLNSDDGTARFVLFDSKKSFLKNPVQAEVREIESGQATWT